MSERPKILAIAGFDPSAGAGVLADIKTAEACGVYGLGAITAVTYQNDSEFSGLTWLKPEDIYRQTFILLKKYPIEYVKIGIIENFEFLGRLLEELFKYNKNIKTVWDPVIKASAGYGFHNGFAGLRELMKKVYLITPNKAEAISLFSDISEHNILKLSQECSCNILIKSYGEDKNNVSDLLCSVSEIKEIKTTKGHGAAKHGTGCVLSSAITSYLALGYNLYESCQKGQSYIKNFLSSGESALGYHYMEEK